MANWSINITESSGTYTLALVAKDPDTAAAAGTGGTDYTPPQANGDPASTISANNPGVLLETAKAIIMDDRSKNGD